VVSLSGRKEQRGRPEREKNKFSAGFSEGEKGRAGFVGGTARDQGTKRDLGGKTRWVTRGASHQGELKLLLVSVSPPESNGSYCENAVSQQREPKERGSCTRYGVFLAKTRGVSKLNSRASVRGMERAIQGKMCGLDGGA